MNQLIDVLLPRPLGSIPYHALEFIFFVAHFFFVLITVGGSFYALAALYRRARTGNEAIPVDPEHKKQSGSEMPVYFASKSLMITFGISVLLLVMAYYSVPFTDAANMNAFFWISIIVFLSAALILLEIFDEKAKGPGKPGMTYGIAGLALLAVVPGIFVAFVVSAENPGMWEEIFRRGLLGTPLFGHWLARLLHVYGASVVIAGMFYSLYAARTGRRNPVAPGTLFLALMVQILVGILLYMSMPSPPGFTVNLFVLIGAGASLGFARTLFVSRKPEAEGNALLSWSIALILIPMLLARQVHQENALVPFSALLDRNRAAFQRTLAAMPPQGENRFLEEKYDDDNLPQFIFQRSCAFCHGGVGNGQGREAGNLAIPPFDLTAIRARPPDLLDAIAAGVPGSAMPYFSIYTGSALKGLAGYLYAYVGVRQDVEPVPVETTPEEQQEAQAVFSAQCAACHGGDGRGSTAGKAFKPPVLDMTAWSLKPEKAFAIIAAGYPGTQMKSYAQVPERVRWALVKRVRDFYGRTKK